MTEYIWPCSRCDQLVELHEPSHVERQAGQVVRYAVVAGHDASPGHEHLPKGREPLRRGYAR